MGLPVIGAHLLNVSNVHNQESTDADIDKYKDSSHIKPHPDKKKTDNTNSQDFVL